MCLSLAPHVLIASAPRAYRSWPSSLSLAGRLLIARGVIDNAKVLHLGRALSDFVRQAGNIFEILLIFPSLRKPTLYIGVPPKGERKYKRGVGFQKGAGV